MKRKTHHTRSTKAAVMRRAVAVGFLRPRAHCSLVRVRGRVRVRVGVRGRVSYP